MSVTKKDNGKPLKKVVFILPMCECTHKPYPHSHEKDKNAFGEVPLDLPWNWEKTHKIWEKAKKSKPKLGASS
jgi:hypothetical protein